MAQLVVKNKVAACAQVDGPIESHYRWESQICLDTEWRLTIKTTASALPSLTELVMGNHPYEQPQWIVLEVAKTMAGYENWVRESVIQDQVKQGLTNFHVHLVGAAGVALGTDFDVVAEQLGTIERLHLELDGSFVWVGEDWQIDGMLYDRDNQLRYVDLKGNCPLPVWQRLASVFASPGRQAFVVLLPEGGLYDLQTFERFTWP